MKAFPGRSLRALLLVLLLVGGIELVAVHSVAGDHRGDECAICHLRSERATAQTVSPPLPAPTLLRETEDPAPAPAPRRIVLHAFSARAPPSDAVVPTA